MTTHEPYTTEAIIINKTISIPLNGEPSTITFQLKLQEDIVNYTDILKDYSDEFILECIGKNVPVTMEPSYFDDGTFKEYIITELHYMEVELYGEYDD